MHSTDIPSKKQILGPHVGYSHESWFSFFICIIKTSLTGSNFSKDVFKYVISVWKMFSFFVKKGERKRMEEGECLLNYHDFFSSFFNNLKSSFSFLFLLSCNVSIFVRPSDCKKKCYCSEIISSSCLLLGLRKRTLDYISGLLVE